MPIQTSTWGPTKLLVHNGSWRLTKKAPTQQKWWLFSHYEGQGLRNQPIHSFLCGFLSLLQPSSSPKSEKHLRPNKGTSGRQSCQAQKQHLWEDWWGGFVGQISIIYLCYQWWLVWMMWFGGSVDLIRLDGTNLTQQRSQMINWPIYPLPTDFRQQLLFNSMYLLIKASLWSPEMLEKWILLFLMNPQAKKNGPFISYYHKIIKPWDKSPEFLQDRSPVRMVVTGIPVIEKLSATVHASEIRRAFSATFFGRYRQHHPWNNSVTTIEKDNKNLGKLVYNSQTEKYFRHFGVGFPTKKSPSFGWIPSTGRDRRSRHQSPHLTCHDELVDPTKKIALKKNDCRSWTAAGGGVSCENFENPFVFLEISPPKNEPPVCFCFSLLNKKSSARKRRKKHVVMSPKGWVCFLLSTFQRVQNGAKTRFFRIQSHQSFRKIIQAWVDSSIAGCP